MLSLIIFGIVALAVIVFLVNMNIRTLSSPEKEVKQPNAHPDAPASTPTASQEKPAKPQPQLTHLPQMNDEQYRKALRQFYAGERKKHFPQPSDKLKDATYRDTLREIRNKSGNSK